MRICIYGAGAIGGYLASQLSLAGQSVSCIVRGAHLVAIRTNGLRLLTDEKEHVTHPRCTNDPHELGPQDFVFTTTKAHKIPEVAASIAPLLGPKTAVITAHNGIPYWYFYKHRGPHANTTLTSVDPGGQIWDMIGPERAIGCVVYPAAEIIKPGIVRHVAGNKFTLCEPDGRQTDRVLRLAELMARAGLEAPINPNIREEIWLKLAANMSVNPTGVLTGGTIGDVVNNPEMARLAVQLAAECQSIAKALGIQNQVRPDQLVDRLRPFSAHKTSMVQDFEARRTLEIDPVIGAVHELAQLTKTPAPTIANVLALVKLKAHLAGL